MAIHIQLHVAGQPRANHCRSDIVVQIKMFMAAVIIELLFAGMILLEGVGATESASTLLQDIQLIMIVGACYLIAHRHFTGSDPLALDPIETDTQEHVR